MTATEPMMIQCGPHGERVSAVICQHLLRSVPAPVGFVENNNDPHDLQAWCHICEDMFQREGGMTAEFKRFNCMAIVCVVCYSEARTRHEVTAGH